MYAVKLLDQGTHKCMRKKSRCMVVNNHVHAIHPESFLYAKRRDGDGHSDECMQASIQVLEYNTCMSILLILQWIAIRIIR